MKTIIIEDEEFAARRLENMIKECDSSIEVIARLQSVKESVEWFKTNPHPELIFLDIQLDDDISFAIFDQVEVTSNIIFTTAFDQYAIKAFQLKSIGYLLKPISKPDLEAALNKHKEWSAKSSPAVDYKELMTLIQSSQQKFRERFSVSVGEKLKFIHVEDIAYFFSTSGITFVVLKNKSQYSIDYSLEALKEMLNPKYFFRINRQYLIHLTSIANVHIFPKSRLKLELNPPIPDEIFVSIEKVVEFKNWLDGE